MPHVTSLGADDPRRVGRYRLAGRISGMPASGPVYLANSVDGDQVTVTLLGSDWAADGAARDRFADEAASARRVPPFCAARILDAGVNGGEAFLVSEYVAGPSLLELVAGGGPLQSADLELLAIGSATGLAAIHQAGLVHGDFGPEHVIIGAAGPRVVAFGITPPYGAATPAADMQAWAQTIAYVAAGQPPASRAALAVLPEPLRQVVTDCLEPSPAARPTARSVVLELLGETSPPAGLLAEASRRAARLSLPAAATPATAPRPGQPRRRRNARIQAAIAGAIVGLLVIVVVAIHIAQNAASQPGAIPGPTRHAAPSPARHSGSPTASPDHQQSLSARPTIPAALTGVWTGQVSQDNPADVFSVKISLAGGASFGRISYAGASFACSGQLSLVSAAANTFTLDQGIVTGQSTCANGIVTLHPSSGGNVAFSFRGEAGPAAYGSLAKQ
jgi:hypothetical protein